VGHRATAVTPWVATVSLPAGNPRREPAQKKFVSDLFGSPVSRAHDVRQAHLLAACQRACLPRKTLLKAKREVLLLCSGGAFWWGLDLMILHCWRSKKGLGFSRVKNAAGPSVPTVFPQVHTSGVGFTSSALSSTVCWCARQTTLCATCSAALIGGIGHSLVPTNSHTRGRWRRCA